MTLGASIELIEGARLGGASEVENLLEAVWPQAYRLAKAIVRQDAAAQDAAQDACVAVYRTIPSLRNANAFGTWFYRIVTREALKQKRLLAENASVEVELPYYDDRDAAADLWRALGRLSTHHRTALVLHYFEGLKGREIAGILGVPHATVRFRLSAARRHLRQLLEESDSSLTAKGEQLYAL